MDCTNKIHLKFEYEVHKLLVQDEVQGWHEPAIVVRAGDKLANRRSEILDKSLENFVKITLFSIIEHINISR
jgi:hypothetical protein